MIDHSDFLPLNLISLRKLVISMQQTINQSTMTLSEMKFLKSQISIIIKHNSTRWLLHRFTSPMSICEKVNKVKDKVLKMH